MTLKIQRSADGDVVVVALSGRIEACQAGARAEPGRMHLSSVGVRVAGGSSGASTVFSSVMFLPPS